MKQMYCLRNKRKGIIAFFSYTPNGACQARYMRRRYSILKHSRFESVIQANPEQIEECVIYCNGEEVQT
jgi:hypothetical protein